MDLFRMAERFSDPLFEKVGELSIQGWVMWLEYFNMEYESEPEPMTETNELIKHYKDMGGYVF